MATFSLAELRRASDEELIRRHDAVAQTTGAGVAYYLDELESAPSDCWMAKWILHLSYEINAIRSCR